MARSRTEIWVTLIVVVAGLAFAAILGLWGYMSATPPLHPNPRDVTSVIYSDPGRPWAAAVDQGRQIVRAGLADRNLPGLSVAVGANGVIAWAEGFGWADLEKRVPVAPDTRFRIGTASTALTSAAVGLLLEKNRLKLDDEIQTYVPEFPDKQWPVTLRQVMGHVAGIKNDGGDEGPLFSVRCERPAQALRYFKDSALLFQPGTHYRYSRYGWILVSATIETAADEGFLSFMRQQVFQPLHMDDTEPDSTTALKLATPYFPRFAADPRYGPDLMRPLDYSCYAGSSVFVSTPSDLVRFAIAISSGKLLRPATVQRLQTSLQLPSGKDTGYGLGWKLETVALSGGQTRTIGHDGDLLGGMVASLAMFPEYGIVVSVASNISYADTSALALKIAEPFAAVTKKRSDPP